MSGMCWPGHASLPQSTSLLGQNMHSQGTVARGYALVQQAVMQNAELHQHSAA